MTTPSLDAFWMPFTANRHFKANPRMLVSADGMYYKDDQGRSILDGCAGLWCVNAGHNRQPIVAAIQRQAATLDYAPPFQMGHPKAFEAAEKLAVRLAAVDPGRRLADGLGLGLGGRTRARFAAVVEGQGEVAGLHPRLTAKAATDHAVGLGAAGWHVQRHRLGAGDIDR